MVFKNTIQYHWTTRDFEFAAAHLINQLLLHSYVFYVFFIINWDTLFLFFIFYYNWLPYLIECLIVFKSTNNKPIRIRQVIYAGLIVGYLNLYEMNLCSQCSVDHIIRTLNILEIYISNRHRCRMKVQYAWVNFEGDNKTQIVNIEEVTTFDVGIRKLKESSVIFHVNWPKLWRPFLNGFITCFQCVCIRNVILYHFRYKEVRYYLLNCVDVTS